MLPAVGCTDTACFVATGYENSSGAPLTPVLLTSTDGFHWTTVDLSYLHLPSMGLLTSISCSSTACSVAGFTGDSSSYKPIILNNAGAGKPWTLVQVSTIGLPVNGQIWDLSCSTLGCIASYNYSTDTLSNVTFFTSNLARTSWTAVPQKNITLPNDAALSYPGADVFSVACSSSICVAGGSYYNNTSNPQHPLLLTNIRKPLCQTWQGVNPTNIPVPNNRHINCSGLAYTGSNFICVGEADN